MATPFSDVYDVFLTKIDDPDLLNMPQPSMEDNMENWMKSSITMFKKCKKDIHNFDDVNKQFNIDLDLDEKEILATWMKYEYLNKQIYREYLLKQSMSSKDYALYSQAQHLKQLEDLKDSTFREARKKVTDYLYDNADYGTFQ